MKNITTNHLQHQVYYYTIHIPGIFQEITLGARTIQQSTKEECAYLCVSASEHWRLTNTHVLTHSRPDTSDQTAKRTHHCSPLSPPTQSPRSECVCRYVGATENVYTHIQEQSCVWCVWVWQRERLHTKNSEETPVRSHDMCVWVCVCVCACVPERKYVHEYARCCVCVCKWRGNKWRETLQTAIKEMWI